MSVCCLYDISCLSVHNGNETINVKLARKCEYKNYSIDPFHVDHFGIRTLNAAFLPHIEEYLKHSIPDSLGWSDYI